MTTGHENNDFFCLGWDDAVNLQDVVEGQKRQDNPEEAGLPNQFEDLQGPVAQHGARAVLVIEVQESFKMQAQRLTHERRSHCKERAGPIPDDPNDTFWFYWGYEA